MLSDTSEMTDEQKKAIAGKLGLSVEQLDLYSGQIIPVKAKNYADFKRQYNKLWHYKGSELQDEAEARIAGYKTGKKTQNQIDKITKNDKLKSSSIQIGKSLGAKAKNYDIELPNKEIVHLTEGTRVTNIQTIAGKGRNRQIDEIDILLERFGGSESEWQKKKGIGYVDYQGESYRANLHWYEEPTAGKHKWKVKPDADGNWFIDED